MSSDVAFILKLAAGYLSEIAQLIEDSRGHQLF